MTKAYYHGNSDDIFLQLKSISKDLEFVKTCDIDCPTNSIVFFEYFQPDFLNLINNSNTLIFIATDDEFEKLLKFSESNSFCFINKNDLSNKTLIKLHLNIIRAIHQKTLDNRQELEKMENKIFDLAFATTDVLQKKEEMEDLAVKDGLTHLYNHSYFKEQLNKLFIKAKNENIGFCVALLDLDFFKNVNDEYGHIAGDQVLKIFASTISDNIRKDDIAARYGGEEFAIIFPDNDFEVCDCILERIRQTFNSYKFVSNDDEFHVTFSAGIAKYTPDFETMYDLLKSADLALYQSKHLGRNRTTVFRI